MTINIFPEFTSYSATYPGKQGQFFLELNFSAKDGLTASLVFNYHQWRLFKLDNEYPDDVIHKYCAIALIDCVYDHLCNLSEVTPNDVIRSIFVANALVAPGTKLSQLETIGTEIVWEVPANTLAYLQGFLTGTTMPNSAPERTTKLLALTAE